MHEQQQLYNTRDCVRSACCEVLLGFFPLSLNSYQGKTLHSCAEDLAGSYQPKRSHPTGWSSYTHHAINTVRGRMTKFMSMLHNWCTGIYLWEGKSSRVRWTIFENEFRMAGKHYHHRLCEEKTCPSGMS